ncbi:MAG: GNAT family N-acetyltransferase [Alphaproteobacteria bacterium]
MTMTVRDNKERRRFEMDVDGGLAFANYRADDSVVVVTHTEVPAALQGRGVGSRFVREMLDLIRANGRKVVPRCGFVAAFIRGHPEYQDLLAR